jgi:hypothetical protein
VIRAASDVASLRRRKLYQAIRWATVVAAARDDFHIVHLSIQGTHVHLLCEATSRLHLARGMQVFQISAARHINRVLGRRGTVFGDRYHSTIIHTPHQARHALAYVLCNWRKHREHRAAFARDWRVDPFSSAIAFDGWKERADALFGFRPPPTYESLVVWLPRSWLLREGWRRHGLISLREVPSRERRARASSARSAR